MRGHNSSSHIDYSKLCVPPTAAPTAWGTVSSIPGVSPSLKDLGARDCSLEATSLRGHCPAENSIKVCVCVCVCVSVCVCFTDYYYRLLQLYKTQRLHVIFTSAKVFTFAILAQRLKPQPLIWSKFLSILHFFLRPHSCLGIQRAMIFPYMKLVSLVLPLE